MRRVHALLLSGAALLPTCPASAADALKFGAPLPWVVEQTIPAASPKTADKPAVILLHDQQTQLEPGKISNFSELAFKIQKPEGLAAGNLSIAWNPATDTVTVNKLEIHRGSQVIDVLASGQKFTTMRRETNLDAAMLDGMLTANIQPEGLQEGDVVVLATTTEHVDPVLKGHVEAIFAPWSSLQIGLAHVRLSWPSNLDVTIRKTGDIPAGQQTILHETKSDEYVMHDVDPVIDPKGAPVRFKIGRLGEATDFRSWADAAKLMIPLYRDAAVVPASGPLRDEVEKIRKVSTDSKTRAEQALALVEERVRYVALLMGEGGYVPAKAEETWSRRFGDCKAKTALLLSLLHELGIEAEPVLVNATAGDAIGEFPPMIGMFNHVLVRAHIAGKDYWLDGTRTGDSALDQIRVPDFGWGLPLIADASLVHLIPAPLGVPDQERRVAVDATGGVFAPASITLTEVYRGDAAVRLNEVYSAASAEQRDQLMQETGKTYFDAFIVTSSSVQFDKSKRELTAIIKGTAKLNWKDGWFDVPTSSISFNADFDRPAGPLHDVPIDVNYPTFAKDIATFTFPPGFAGQQKLDAPIHETLAGVEYSRTETAYGNVLTVESSERSVVPEVPYKLAVADAPRLRALSKDDVYLRSAVAYRPTEKDLAALNDATPDSPDEYVARGNLYANGKKFDEAIADYSQALKLDADNKWALADRGLAYVWKQQYAEAEKDLTAAAARDPGNDVVLRGQGLMAEFKGDCPKSIDFFTKSLSKDPGNGFALGHRATCEARVSKDDEALADSAAALKADPSWMDLRVTRANILMHEGKRELVAKEAEAMIRENPTSDFAWVGAGKIYSALGQSDKAMEALNRALAIKPYAYIYINRAQIRPPSDFAARMADLDAALKLEPHNPDALSVKAWILSEHGDYKGALTLLDEIPPGPEHRYTDQTRAVMLFKAGQSGEAGKLFQSLRNEAKTAGDLNNLCWVKATAGVSLESALQDCRDALKMSPGRGQYLDSLGMVLLKLGRLDEALDAYTQAIAKNIGADSLMGRAFVYQRKGDTARANADAAAARKMNADIYNVFAEYDLKFDAPPGPGARVAHRTPAATN